MNLLAVGVSFRTADVELARAAGVHGRPARRGRRRPGRPLRLRGGGPEHLQPRRAVPGASPAAASCPDAGLLAEFLAEYHGVDRPPSARTWSNGRTPRPCATCSASPPASTA